ncbi:hypothetical protein R1sor_027264 [Riccia sorocarpa]|uniref:Uncharacterized protein n=1 Tax=Riccia sorocarpa TaxID=122646 RepID=A0ABD3GF76_9MARC
MAVSDLLNRNGMMTKKIDKPEKTSMSEKDDDTARLDPTLAAAVEVLKPSRKPRTVPLKDLDVSITVGISGEDVKGETFDK